MKLKVILSLLAILLFNCEKKSENVFLQPGDIRIAQPRLEATNQFIDSSTYLTASLKLEGTKIYYTSNGAVPTQKDQEYTEPIQVKTPGVYKFKAIHPDWKESDISEIVFYEKGIPIDSIIWKSNPHQRYSGTGKFTLSNNKKGSLNFQDSQWLGFDTIARASLYLDHPEFVNSLTIGYLSDPGSWIFPPESVTVQSTSDGIIYKDKTVVLTPLEKGSPATLKTIQVPIEDVINELHLEVKNVSSIPQWHEGNGTKAWIFMDEWVLNK